MEPSDKSVEIMRKFSEQYARKSGTYFCVDKGVTSVVIKVLLSFPFLFFKKKLRTDMLWIDLLRLFFNSEFEFVGRRWVLRG